jgi:uncharacterized protein
MVWMNAIADFESTWQPVFMRWLEHHAGADSAHDSGHILRVVANARKLAMAEGADWKIVLPAAWLHDCVVVPKSSPERALASRFAARQAVDWLKDGGWPHGKLEEIGHAIEAHSFSAGIEPRTQEAEVLQDADRLDALGAVGLARTLMLGAEMGRTFYQTEDPFCRNRDPDDAIYTLDHVYRKLLTLESTMRTESGRREAASRTRFLRDYLAQMESEIGW